MVLFEGFPLVFSVGTEVEKLILFPICLSGLLYLRIGLFDSGFTFGGAKIHSNGCQNGYFYFRRVFLHRILFPVGILRRKFGFPVHVT